MSGHDSKYFSTTKKGEIPELKEELNSQYKVSLSLSLYIYIYIYVYVMELSDLDPFRFWFDARDNFVANLMRLAGRSIGLRFDLHKDFIGLAFCDYETFLNCTDRSCFSLSLCVTNFFLCSVAKKIAGKWIRIWIIFSESVQLGVGWDLL